MSQPATDGAEIIRQFIPQSPFRCRCGLAIESLEPDRATLRLPFSPELTTVEDIVHGGALATALDCAVAAASWSGVAAPETPRGSTITLSVSYLAPAQAVDVLVEGRVLARGRNITHVQALARDADTGQGLAHALSTYRLG